MTNQHEIPDALFKMVYQHDIFEQIWPKMCDNEIIGKKLMELYEQAKKYNENYLDRVSNEILIIIIQEFLKQYCICHR